MARCRRSTFTNEIFCFFFSELLLYTPVHLPDTFLSTNGSQQIHVRPTEDETFSNKKKKKEKERRDCGIHVTSQVKMYVYKKKKKKKTTHMVAVVDVYDHWVRFFFMMMNARFLSFSSSRKQNTLLDCNKNQTTTELTGVETFGERNQFDERPLVFFFSSFFLFFKMISADRFNWNCCCKRSTLFVFTGYIYKYK